MHRSVFENIAATKNIESCDGTGSVGAYVEVSEQYRRVPEDLFFFLGNVLTLPGY